MATKPLQPGSSANKRLAHFGPTPSSIASAAEAFFVNVIDYDDTSPDAALLSNFNMRQRALAAIEARGAFFDCETVSPAHTEVFDAAEYAVAEGDALTDKGVLAKLWVVFSHMGGQILQADDRVLRDAIRRADLADVGAHRDSLDFEMQTMLGAINSLSKIAEGK